MATELSRRAPQAWQAEAASIREEESYVLIVDDDLAVRQFLERCLSLDGYHVRQAGSADAALEVMAERPASLVLCDIKMEGHDGLWLTERLQSEWPSTSIVMITAMDDATTIQQARALGAVDYLTKPLNPTQLRQVVKRVVAREHVPQETAHEVDGGPSDTMEAEYTLETTVRCPACGERTNTLIAVRLVRARVHFTSTLPRRGRVLACPHCLAIVPGTLTNF